MTSPPRPLVLYVDDERPNRLVLEQTFADRFNVRSVASGAEALEVLRGEPVAVLITDQRMPGMSGHELLVRVKAAHPSVIRVVMTAYSDLDPILRAVNEGLVARYVIKPWDHLELEQLILWALKAHALGQEDAALQLRLMQTERLTTLGSVSAALVHDLVEPLTSLDYNCDRLTQLAGVAAGLPGAVGDEAARRGLAELAAELTEIAEEAKRSCQLMLQMTDSIRQFGKPATAAESAASCQPDEVVRQVLSLTREIALRRRARLAYDGPAGLPAVRIAAVELTQILINVLANATHAIERAGRPGAVTIRAEVGPDAVELQVTDDGGGMPPDVLARAGTPFFTTHGEGVGLGVAQCHRLTGRAGGSFALGSDEGVGTTATIRLPRV